MRSFLFELSTVVSGGRWLWRYALATRPWYWRTRRSVSRLAFGAWKRVYLARGWAKGRVERGTLLLQIGAAVLWPIVRAVLAVAALAVIEHRASVEWPAVGVWLRSHAPDAGLYAALAETIAQIAGAFLGLYLAALSVVVSTSYATAPPDVRSLLITEPASSAFLQALAFTTGAALIVLGIQTVGWTPGTLNFWFLAVLSLISVFGVVQLGLGVLTLFDPAAHTGRLAHAVFKAARSATGEGFRARDRSFQAAYQRDAEQSLATYERLVEIAIGQGAGG